ncbi:MAG: PAS domain-containing protein [Desulfobacteraceae bacterium]|nr:PAS domain-containing protein [Desulfobacteraceae bacterium]
MTHEHTEISNVAIVGGGELCEEVLEKTTFDYEQGVDASIIAVADSDPESPGIAAADKRGLITLSDYHDLFHPRYSIHLILILTPDENIFEDIVKTRPFRIRILSYNVFKIFWDAIGREGRKLSEQHKALQTILNGIQDFILVLTSDLEIVEANEAFLKKLGYSKNEVVGKKCHQVYRKIDHQCDSGDVICPMTDVVRNKRQIRQIHSSMGKDGNPRYTEVNVYPIWEKGGRIAKFIHISRDITQRVREEEELTRLLEQMVEERTKQLRETHEQLRHQDKMASLGKLSASVVHEINNPIAGILNLLMLMKRITGEGPVEEKEIDQFNQYLNLMETETRRISRIVSNLLAFSRQSKIDMRTLDLSHLIETTLFMNSNLLKINRIKVEKNLEPNLPLLVGSEDQLQQVFMNLISNAAEAMEGKGGGVLLIETHFSLSNNNITISFSDTGVGIPSKNESKLFEPFFTTKKKGKGVGLGLSVAYGIIKEHGGCINVESEVGKGTTFKVVLPLKTGKS